MTVQTEIADQEKQVFAVVRKAGLHFTENRRAILAVFLAVTEPVTVSELWFRAKKVDSRTSHGTVWRLLTALTKCGLAHRNISPADGILRYGPVRMECAHERVACKDCGAVISPEGGQHDHVPHRTMSRSSP